MRANITQTYSDAVHLGLGNQYLTFLLGGQEYAVDILRVQEIKSWGPVTALPSAPPYVLGVINLRGVLVPLMDLRVRFDVGAATYTPTTAVIVVRSGERIVGLVVDQVCEVYQLTDAMIQDNVGRDMGVGADYLRGVATVEDQMIIVLSLDQVIESSIVAADAASVREAPDGGRS
jgi:purine-binding chemotaxis protein CheW